MGQPLNLINKIFGMLTVVKKDKNIKNYTAWICKCSCGSRKSVRTGSLTSGNTKSCGCLYKIRAIKRGEHLTKQLAGQKFGRLTVIKKDFSKKKNPKRKSRSAYWLCKCSCGKEKIISSHSLRRTKKPTKSCGCYAKEIQAKIREKRWEGWEGRAAYNNIYGIYKRNAKYRDLNFDLDEEIFKKLIYSNCYYCDSLPKNLSKNKHNHGDVLYNGIDRKNNSIGYTVDNCVPCCALCNKSKNTTNYNEFIEWIINIYENLKLANR